MNIKRTRTGPCHRLEVHDCPIGVLEALARAAGTDATVENVVPVPARDEWFESVQAIHPGGPAGRHRIRNATFDVALRNEEFLALMPFWDQRGVYAVFTERSPVAFQASRLDPAARYRALAQFGFVLEFALAGPSSHGWSEIVSPRVELIELAERQLAGHGS